jgi:hypothetical protein
VNQYSIGIVYRYTIILYLFKNLILSVDEVCSSSSVYYFTGYNNIHGGILSAPSLLCISTEV